MADRDVREAVRRHEERSSPALWHVTRVETFRDFPPGADPVDYETAYYTTRSGVQAYETLPKAISSAEAFAAVIKPEAERLERIANMRGEG